MAARVSASRINRMSFSYDPTRPATYPINGRTLTDDVSNVFLSVLTNGKLTGDMVGPHADLLDEFPFLGMPHNATLTPGSSGYVSDMTSPSP